MRRRDESEEVFENYSRIMEVPEYQTMDGDEVEPVQVINRLSYDLFTSPISQPDQPQSFYDVGEGVRDPLPQSVSEFTRTFSVIQGPVSRTQRTFQNA